MANETNDISDIVKKCKILLLDIEGTTTSISFVKDKLFPYAEENVKSFLDSQWESEDVKNVVSALRKLALEDKENSVDGVVAIPGEDASKEDQIEGLVKSVKWQMSADRKAGPLKELQGLIWKQGYDKGDIKGHVYDDVSPALESWRASEGQKVYIYSSGSVQAQKLLFGQSSAGDLLKYIDGHFDTAVGAKQEQASYAAIAEKIGCKPEEVLFLTDIVKEAEAARASGIHSALVSREGNAALPPAAPFPVLYSLAQLAHPNKRKPQEQDEQPAKVLKTDVDADVKTSAESEVTPAPEAPAAAEAPQAEQPPTVPEPSPNTEAVPVVQIKEVVETKPAEEEPEKMEVDEAPAKDDVAPPENEKPIEKVETKVKEVTDIDEIATPVCDIELIIEESSDKTEMTETENKETKSSASVTEPKESAELKNGDKDAPIPEETPPTTIITEIKDITDEKEDIAEEMIDNVEPIVEEPAQDMEELQNVGEVLEKECDEILSKVQDVTNLDNIPIKPLLNTIAEETMDTDNMDSNDIVEGILDSEMEMEMKQTAEKEAQVAEKAAETEKAPESKAVTEEAKIEDKTEKPEVASTESKTVPPEEPTEKVAETKVTEEKVEESNVKETKAEESKPAVENDTKPEEVKIATKIETEVSSTPKAEDSKTKDVDTKVEEVKSAEEVATEEKKVEAEKSESEKKELAVEQITKEAEPAPVDTEKKVPEEAKPEEPKETKEAQVNGKATNGDAAIPNLNGDASKDDELSARLSMENGKEAVNGANGDSNKVDQGKKESAEVEVADIKVKTVAVDEPRNDPIEQPTEA
ncbi:unnamed protein product [Chrysodeixis includens]|uniref:Enolase-phosphatase E1 n=1 Tax=Chrysodeixis includens TaxID=689277 RepID=A0A9P0BU77_CHRIL|nr:unnamed protein product [Chrysodeixis includens]